MHPQRESLKARRRDRNIADSSATSNQLSDGVQVDWIWKCREELRQPLAPTLPTRVLRAVTDAVLRFGLRWWSWHRKVQVHGEHDAGHAYSCLERQAGLAAGARVRPAVDDMHALHEPRREVDLVCHRRPEV